MKRRVSIFIFVATAVLATALAVRAQRPLHITGTYSNMYVNEEAGEVLGEELKIVVTTGGYQGALQFAQGVPSELILVDVSATENKISFSFAGTDPYSGRFTGMIDRDSLTGEFKFKNGASEKVEMQRRKSYWD